MKLKAAISYGAPRNLVEAFGSPDFAAHFFEKVVGEVFGADNPLERPAEYYVQRPDDTIQVGDAVGIEVRLTGVSRGGRPAKVFHQALAALEDLVIETAQRALKDLEDTDLSVQIFVVLMLDGDVETAPGSASYSSVLEGSPKWVDANRYGTERVLDSETA